YCTFCVPGVRIPPSPPSKLILFNNISSPIFKKTPIFGNSSGV
ncbi:uncharacterized protein METZ01_LOCUS442969, partial [marine metagenome]